MIKVNQKCSKDEFIKRYLRIAERVLRRDLPDTEWTTNMLLSANESVTQETKHIYQNIELVDKEDK